MKIIYIFLLIMNSIILSVNAKAQSGELDLTFNSSTGANNGISDIAIQSDGKIIIVGAFSTYNATARNGIARLNVDGSLDATFNVGTGTNNLVVNSTAIQSDGKIMIGGYFTMYNGTAINRIARLNTDGSLDATFNPGTGANGPITDIVIQSDGKIIIGGFFTIYNGTTINRIARLNADGSIDATFNVGTGANTNVYNTAIQSNGKIIIGGDFSTYNGTAINRIARLNTNGTIDVTFNPGTGANNTVRSTAFQNDGKIIIGGDFSLYNSTTINRIARLNTDGSIDATFNSGTGTNSMITDIVIQSDGKIIIGGLFTSYNGTARNRIARLNDDGSLDVSFNPGTGANNNVWTTDLQSDGKIIIGGEFTSYNTIGRNRIARIYSCSAIPAQPSTIVGSTTPCYTSSQNYSVTNVAGVNYTWTLPTGWTQTSGGTTNAITVTVGASSGNITVTPSNSCGIGTAQTLAVLPADVPIQPSTIIGNVTPYFGTIENYSVTSVAGVAYNWIFPTGWVQTSGGNTNSVAVTIGSGSGYIICIPSNSCGDGTPRTLAVAVYGVGIKENINKNNIIIYPNPTEGNVSLNFKGYTGDIKLTLNNALGEFMFSESIMAVSDNFFKEIEMAKYPNGIYYIQIVNNGKFNIEKIVKLD